MALDLTSLAAKTHTIPVEFMGQTALVTYNPAVLTSANITKAQSGKDEDFIAVFTDLVKDWDVKKGAKKVPLTAKGLSEVPIPLLKAIFRGTAISGGTGSEEEGKNSSAG
jgi:hypothetical protein